MSARFREIHVPGVAAAPAPPAAILLFATSCHHLGPKKCPTTEPEAGDAFGHPDDSRTTVPDDRT